MNMKTENCLGGPFAKKLKVGTLVSWTYPIWGQLDIDKNIILEKRRYGIITELYEKPISSFQNRRISMAKITSSNRGTVDLYVELLTIESEVRK